MNESPDLLTRMFANRVVRNIIAVALILYAADSLYNSGKAMVSMACSVTATPNFLMRRSERT